MIKRLQKKLILISMTAFLLVMAVIISVINISNYIGVVDSADELLEILSINKGAFPKEPFRRDDRFFRDMSPEVPYETRFFVVTLNAETGGVVLCDTGRIASVDTTEAIEYANRAFREGEQSGFIGNFRYRALTEGEFYRAVFLDCGRKLESAKTFLLISVSVTLAGYALVFLAVAFLSNRIVRPISLSYEKQKRFITDAGHEIKTPLSVISADISVLEMDLGENEWLSDVQKQVKRLSSLTEDLVYLARMEESSNPIRFVDFPISDVISEAAESFKAPAQTLNIKLETDIKPLLTIKGDAKAAGRLVSILLDNAIKYSPEGGTVRLTLEKQGSNVKLGVYNKTADEIDKDSLPKLFERFYRADASRSTAGGYGIGLSIASAIMEKHAGSIRAFSDDGKSLLIVCTFPA